MIKLSQIEKVYDSPSGPVKALRNISLEIGRGEIYGIIGLSGAGKSTLIRCINMLERPTSGQVIVDSRDLTAMSEGELRKARKEIGMIFQHFNLLSSATVYDNIAFPLRLSGTGEDIIRKKVEPLLNLVGLADKAHQYPSQLSGGQKQRVGIARALASDPKVEVSLDTKTTKNGTSSILDSIVKTNAFASEISQLLSESEDKHLSFHIAIKKRDNNADRNKGCTFFFTVDLRCEVINDDALDIILILRDTNITVLITESGNRSNNFSVLRNSVFGSICSSHSNTLPFRSNAHLRLY